MIKRLLMTSKPKIKVTLFWKILFWFWISMISIITLNVFIVQLNSEKIHFRPLPPPLLKELNLLETKVERSINHSIGQSRRQHPLNKRLHNVYLLDHQGQDYFQREVPVILADLHSRVLRSNKPYSVFKKRHAFFGGKIIQLQKKDHYLYSFRDDSLLNRHFIAGFFKDLSISVFFSIFIISFPVSFFLSWIITRPIRQLQKASQDMIKDLNNRKNIYQLLKRSDEFGELANDFDHLAQHLNKTLISQKQLISDVSHELRSPLTRLQIALAMADKKQIKGVSTELARIKLESGRMNLMLENLLTLSKLESQSETYNKEAIDLCQLFRIIIADGQFEANRTATTIQLIAPQQFILLANKESLISGIDNILRNAIKYTGQNGLITCCLVQQNNQLTLSISDNGPGVAEEQLDKLFDAFYRPEFDRNRNSGGVGLGLSIAKRAFAMCGGEITAENILPHGLKVTVKFKSNFEPV